MDITHCPECSTAFKVSPEQLALASGWVRCGRCGAVFEAQHHLSAPMPSQPPPAPAPEPEPLQDGWDHEASWITSLDEPKPAGQAAIAQTSPPPQPTRSQITWLIACGVMLLLFAWQVIVSQRHLLAAEEPSLKPWLEVLCAPLACEVEWPQEPHSIQIENTSFNEDPEGGYALQIRLRNTQHHPVATPYLELSLIDLQDQVVVRRVFSVQEMGLPESLAALRDARATIHFDLDAKVSDHVSGFHALIFYP